MAPVPCCRRVDHRPVATGPPLPIPCGQGGPPAPCSSPPHFPLLPLPFFRAETLGWSSCRRTPSSRPPATPQPGAKPLPPLAPPRAPLPPHQVNRAGGCPHWPESPTPSRSSPARVAAVRAPPPRRPATSSLAVELCVLLVSSPPSRASSPSPAPSIPPPALRATAGRRGHGRRSSLR